MANITFKTNLLPSVGNTHSLGSSENNQRWYKLFIGNSNSYGSSNNNGSNQPIYWNNGVPEAITYIANRLYYPSAVNAFSAGNHYVENDKIAINKTDFDTNNSLNYNFYVNGQSYLVKNLSSDSTTGSPSIKSSQLIIANENGGDSAIELWREGAEKVSWQLINSGGIFYLKNNYNLGTQNTYLKNSFSIHNNGQAAIPGTLTIGQEGRQGTYKLYVNGTTNHTDYIYRSFNASDETPMLWMKGNSTDNYLFQISGQSDTDKQYYGYGLKYIGTGTGVNNLLNLYADNSNGENDVCAISINQSGKVGIGTEANNDYRLYVNGFVVPSEDNKNYLGDNSKAWKGLFIKAQSSANDYQIRFVNTNSSSNEIEVKGIIGASPSGISGRLGLYGASDVVIRPILNGTSEGIFISKKDGDTLTTMRPSAHGTHNLGTEAYHWANGYFNNLFVSTSNTYTATNSTVAGSAITEGYFDATATSPALRLHRANAAAITGQIASDTTAGVHITGTVPADPIQYNSKNVSPILKVDGTTYVTSSIESGGQFLNNRGSAGGGYYLYGNGVQYGRLHINTIGTSDTVGLVRLTLGNGTAVGLENNAKGALLLYGENTSYTALYSLANTTSRAAYLQDYSNQYLVHTGQTTIGTGNNATTSTQVGSGTQPVYVADKGRVTAITYTKNRLYYPKEDSSNTSSTVSKEYVAGNHYVENDKIAINKTDFDTNNPLDYTFYVNGKTKIDSTTASSLNNESGQLIVSNGSGGNIAIELWRNNRASWQLANEDGIFYLRNNYTTAINTTYTQTGLIMNYNSGNTAIPGKLSIGQTTRNATYQLYVNGTSYHKGDDTHAGNILPEATAGTRDIGSTTIKWNNIYASIFHGNLDGHFTTERKISLTGAVTGDAMFDGSKNINIATEMKEPDGQGNKFLRNDGTWSNTLIGPLYINHTADTSGTTKTGAVMVGDVNAKNIAIDNDEIMARNNGAVSTLILNNDGGVVKIGSGGLNINGSNIDYKLYVNGTSYLNGDTTVNGASYYAKSGALKIGDIPATSAYSSGLVFHDKDGTVIGRVQPRFYATSGTYAIILSCGDNTIRIGKKIDTDSSDYAYFSNPALWRDALGLGSIATINKGTSTTTFLRNDGTWATPTDTKNTAGSTNTSSKIFLIGAASQAANPQTYSHDTAYVGTDGCLYSGGDKVLTSHQDISGKVSKSGDTMTGALILKNADMPTDTTTSTSTSIFAPSISFHGTTSQGWIRYGYFTSKRMGFEFTARRNINDAWKYNQLYLTVDTNGEAYVSLGGTGAAAAWRTAINAVNKAGDTMTDNLTISKAKGPELILNNSSNNLQCSILIGSGQINHGLYSYGYATSTTTVTSSAKWIIYRDTAGDARTQLKLYGAVWNDYAEFRETKDKIEPGRCIREIGDDTLELTTERLMRGCEIVSDTYGFAIGESDKCKTPTAASGRVLAYLYEDREIAKSHIGWPVCSGPNGTVSIMTEEEEEKYPSRIIGTISAIPDYEIWHAGSQDGEEAEEIKVNGRIWIRIR